MVKMAIFDLCPRSWPFANILSSQKVLILSSPITIQSVHVLLDPSAKFPDYVGECWVRRTLNKAQRHYNVWQNAWVLFGLQCRCLGCWRARAKWLRVKYRKVERWWKRLLNGFSFWLFDDRGMTDWFWRQQSYDKINDKTNWIGSSGLITAREGEKK
jgi:hypothetical protein